MTEQAVPIDFLPASTLPAEPRLPPITGNSRILLEMQRAREQESGHVYDTIEQSVGLRSTSGK